MARIRMIKPEFFDDPDVADLSMAARLCFIGLWTEADKSGFLVDDHRRLKVRLFPYDEVNIDALMSELATKGMITRYTAADQRAYVWIPKFLKHQRPHPKEAPSVIPPPLAPAVKKHCEPFKNIASPSESGVLILESGVLSSEDGRTRAAASPRPVPVENPSENVRVITRLAHTIIDADPKANFADWKADIKAACSDTRIAYDADVAGKALESALAQRARIA